MKKLRLRKICSEFCPAFLSDMIIKNMDADLFAAIFRQHFKYGGIAYRLSGMERLRTVFLTKMGIDRLDFIDMKHAVFLVKPVAAAFYLQSDAVCFFRKAEAFFCRISFDFRFKQALQLSVQICA